MGKQHYQDSPSEKEKKTFAKYLAEDEELILATGYGKAYRYSYFLVSIIWPGAIFMLLGLGVSYLLQLNPGYGLGLGLILSGVVAYFRAIHLFHANRYLLTTRRAIIKKGVFAVQLSVVLYDKITHIEVDQSFTDKLFYHHGTVIINTAGVQKVEMALKYIDYPIEFKNLLERLINHEREQYGLHSGPILTVEGELVSDK